MHRLRNRRQGKVGHMAIKLDINKAYDRVEWEFLRKIMLKMGFLDRWVNLAMQGVSLASYSVLINREPWGFIHPTRGIKQGDLLSPYLFLFCMEGPLGMLRKSIEAQHTQGIMSYRNRVTISHLLFANDSLLFCPATSTKCHLLLHILGTYERASGQAINRQKAALFFKPNTDRVIQHWIWEILGLADGGRKEQGEYVQRTERENS